MLARSIGVNIKRHRGIPPTTHMITIAKIELSNRENSTEVCDIITLSDGRVIYAWNGAATYCVYDKVTGSIKVGAQLVEEQKMESYNGLPYTLFVFVGTGWDTPPEYQQVYVPGPVWGSGNGPTVSEAEARTLGATNINNGSAIWPKHYFES